MKKVIITPPDQEVILLKDTKHDDLLLVLDDLPFESNEFGPVKIHGSRQWYVEEKKSKQPHNFTNVKKTFFDSIYMLYIVLRELGYVIYLK